MPKLTTEPAPSGSRRRAKTWSRWLAKLRMEHPGDGIGFRQEVEHATRIGHVLRHAQRQGLDPLEQLEGVGRAHAGAEIAQPLGARAHDEGLRSEFGGESMP